MNLFAWLIFVGAAVLEVGGDAVVRTGLRGRGNYWILGGMLLLGFYGLMVNKVQWDFSKLLGVYVAVFAVISVLAGRLIFKETIPSSTWLGLLVIVAGGLIVQFGSR
jgi:small multidrug resistance family-3 protein